MTGWSPPTLSRGQLAGIIVGLLAVAAYSVVIVGQLLLVVLPAAAVVVVYLIWRLPTPNSDALLIPMSNRTQHSDE